MTHERGLVDWWKHRLEPKDPSPVPFGYAAPKQRAKDKRYGQSNADKGAHSLWAAWTLLEETDLS
jgi:hypothetical protein